jgi:hypothetical protein
MSKQAICIEQSKYTKFNLQDRHYNIQKKKNQLTTNDDTTQKTKEQRKPNTKAG